jgi:hypothetical protein
MDTSIPERDNDDERWQRSVSARLSKLRTMPVDATRLERAIRAQLPQPPREKVSMWRPRLRSMRAIAASLLVVGLLTAVLVLSTSGGPALASPAQMARLHEDLVSGKVPVMQVDSIDSANKALSSQWPEAPGVPGVPENHVMACCMKSVKDKKVACVLLKREGVPVTMTVANASDMQLPKSPTVNRNGVSYHVQSSANLNMVMTERQGRWICLIGELGSERLMDLADQLQF